jgi:hypothetical protein
MLQVAIGEQTMGRTKIFGGFPSLKVVLLVLKMTGAQDIHR